MTLRASPGEPVRPLVGYVYAGRVLDRRETATETGGIYTCRTGYDSHRRVNLVANSFAAPGRSPASIADYSFTRDPGSCEIPISHAGSRDFVPVPGGEGGGLRLGPAQADQRGHDGGCEKGFSHQGEAAVGLLPKN